MTKLDYVPEQYRVRNVDSLQKLFNEKFTVMDQFRGPKLVMFDRELSEDFNGLAKYMAQNFDRKITRAEVIEGQGSSLSALSNVQLNSNNLAIKNAAEELSVDFKNLNNLLFGKMFLNIKMYLSPTFTNKAKCNIEPLQHGWERYVVPYTGESAGEIFKYKTGKGSVDDLVSNMLTDENQSPVALPKHNLLLVADYKP